ncbi:hypothetical protein RY831_04750 [Noviherbaspirillum sp. CPCC 100848]|uniref:Transposase n=1 Tax=Noviherbaspirillum album TaxID=3080276 RepID=A0ABU6J4Q9_9BURK|nr:hypothetical protein [Noviherbaspirillum sp. CPCC 100848]MEC4718443.1 hypothetical protein [Noviherbaspirillum sp. CPCC 100848]
MRKKRFAVGQIVVALKEAEVGMPAQNDPPHRQHGADRLSLEEAVCRSRQRSGSLTQAIAGRE